MELAAPGARRRPELLDRRLARSAGYVFLALAATAGAAGIAAAGSATPLEVAARALIVGVPATVGLGTYARTGSRFGLTLAALGAALLVSTLGEMDDDVAYTVGRAAGWLVEILLVYAILAFPTGRLPERTDRALVAAMATIVLVLFVPRLAVAERFELPAPYTSCTEGCPVNALFAFDRQHAFVEAFVRPAGALAVIALSVAVLWRLRDRIRQSSPLARRMLALVLAVGMARIALFGVGFAARQYDPSAAAVQLMSWALAFSAPALALAFLVSIWRWELQAARAVERLARRVADVANAAALRAALAEAFDDPRFRLVVPAVGEPLRVPEPEVGRCVSEIRERGTPVAAAVYDEALRTSPRTLDAGLSVAGVVLANQRLAAEAVQATRELRSSRARIAASAERERRRIERDLHDGAQQRLVALRIELELAEDLVRQDPSKGIGRLRELEGEVDEALEELRSLAHGVYPPLLADRGLPTALRTLAARWAIPVEVEARSVERYAAEVESAVYFCVLEALQNVLKHARGARRVRLHLDGGRGVRLRFRVRDDGVGAPEGRISPGAGIANMRDRLAAVGGEVVVTSEAGTGTTVEGYVPISPRP